MRIAFADAAPSATLTLRRVVFGIWALILLSDPAVGLADLPSIVFEPAVPWAWLPSIAFDAGRTESALLVIRLIGGGGALLAALGWRFRVTATIAVLGATMHRASISSLAFVNHAPMALLLASWCLLLCAWADERAKRDGMAGENSAPWTPFLVLAVILYSYSATAIYRISHGDLGLLSGDSIAYWSTRNHALDLWESALPIAVGDHVASQPLLLALLRVGFPWITLMELLAPMALFSGRFRVAFAATMIPFHVLSVVVLSVFFWGNSILLGILLIWIPLRERRSA